MKIDIHTHIMPDKMPNWVQKFGYGEFIHLEHRNCKACMMKGDKLFREVDDNSFDTIVRLKEMDETEVTIQVLSTIPVLFNYWAKPKDGLETSRFFNDDIANKVVKNTDRFIGIGTVPLQDIDFAIAEMERCITQLKMPGLQIGSNINGENLSDKKYFPFYKRAEELGCALFIHPWEMMGQDEMKKYWLPWLVGMPAETSRAACSMIFGGVLERLPKLRVCFSHAGGSFLPTLGRIEHGFNCRPDLVAIDNQVNPREYVGKFWVDSITHDIDALKYILNMQGSKRVCLGSDYPFPLGDLEIGKFIEESDLSKTQIEDIFCNATLEWLGLEKPEFL